MSPCPKSGPRPRTSLHVTSDVDVAGSCEREEVATWEDWAGPGWDAVNKCMTLRLGEIAATVPFMECLGMDFFSEIWTMALRDLEP